MDSYIKTYAVQIYRQLEKQPCKICCRIYCKNTNETVCFVLFSVVSFGRVLVVNSWVAILIFPRQLSRGTVKKLKRQSFLSAPEINDSELGVYPQRAHKGARSRPLGVR